MTAIQKRRKAIEPPKCTGPEHNCLCMQCKEEYERRFISVTAALLAQKRLQRYERAA